MVGGMRTKGYKISNKEKEPLVTVITVVFNAIDTIEKTILSVINQSYSNIEYIIIDGGSNDGTLDVIRKYEEKIYYWISEPDNGIYDAMNKGIDEASGYWINFMNSGDSFCSNEVLEILFMGKDYDNVDVLFGNSFCIDFSGNKIIQKPISDSKELLKSVTYRHGASFVKTEVHKKNKFDLSRKDLGYALDYLCIFNLCKNGFVFKYIDLFILNYLLDGVSNNYLKNQFYVFKITSKNGYINALIRYVRKVVLYYVHRLINLVYKRKGEC